MVSNPALQNLQVAASDKLRRTHLRPDRRFSLN